MPLTHLQIGIFTAMVAVFAGLALFACFRARRVTYPVGPLNRRGTVLGNEVVVIDAPGTQAKRLMLIEACATATVAVFTAWRVWRPSDAGGETLYPIITVHFIEDRAMDEVQIAMLAGKQTSAYLSDASSSVQRVPLIIVRKSCAESIIAQGQPIIHEAIHALMNCFLPDARDEEQSREVWDYIQNASCVVFRDLYSPEALLQKQI